MPFDCHVNIWNPEHVSEQYAQQSKIARADKAIGIMADVDTLYNAMQDVDKAIIFGLKYGTSIGIEVPDEITAQAVKKYPDKFIGFASINPTYPQAVDSLKFSIEKLGLKGVKMGPIYQNFHLSDPRVTPIYEYCQKNNIPITMHMGTTFGKDCPIDYGRPIHVEPIALRYPNLKLILAHMGHPWENDCIVIIRKQPNVYAEISALCYRPWQYYNSMILAQEYGVMHKIFWGTDFPFSTVEESINGINNINQFLEGTKLPRVSKENIDRILFSNPLEHWWH